MNHRDFTAEYVYKEYPKWVTLADGSRMLVENADEEAVLTAPKPSEGDDKGGEEAERQELLEKAKALGLKVHPATGLDKLRKMIADAG